MATLRVFQKPEGFELPNQYQRRVTGEGGNNYSYVRPLNSEIDGAILHELGVYFELAETVPYPTETGIGERDITRTVFLRYRVYDYGNDRLFCLGSSIDTLEEPLRSHSGTQNLFVAVIDLVRLDNAIQNGQLSLVGQTCVVNGGSLKKRLRKLDGIPFAPHDPEVQRGQGVTQECFELLIDVGGVAKTFYVYANGTVTSKRAPNNAESYAILRSVYDAVMAVM
jgi:hypothetical protein